MGIVGSYNETKYKGTLNKDARWNRVKGDTNTDAKGSEHIQEYRDWGRPYCHLPAV